MTLHQCQRLLQGGAVLLHPRIAGGPDRLGQMHVGVVPVTESLLDQAELRSRARRMRELIACLELGQCAGVVARLAQTNSALDGGFTWLSRGRVSCVGQLRERRDRTHRADDRYTSAEMHRRVSLGDRPCRCQPENRTPSGRDSPDNRTITATIRSMHTITQVRRNVGRAGRVASLALAAGALFIAASASAASMRRGDHGPQMACTQAPRRSGVR